MSHSDILEAIDSSLRDNSVSADAMRWSPDPEAAEVFPEITVPFGGLTVGAPRSSWIEVSSIDFTCGQAVLSGEGYTRSGSDLAYSRLSPWSVKATFVLDEVSECNLVYVFGLADRRHRIRCRQCNPAGNPLPLPGGQEYRRRQQARRRRAN